MLELIGAFICGGIIALIAVYVIFVLNFKDMWG